VIWERLLSHQNPHKKQWTAFSPKGKTSNLWQLKSFSTLWERYLKPRVTIQTQKSKIFWSTCCLNQQMKRLNLSSDGLKATWKLLLPKKPCKKPWLLHYLNNSSHTRNKPNKISSNMSYALRRPLLNTQIKKK